MKELIKVYRSDMSEPIAIIEKYVDPNHPRRKWCYRCGFHRYYSETATTLSDMLNEYISVNIDWLFCAKNGITIRFEYVEE